MVYVFNPAPACYTPGMGTATHGRDEVSWGFMKRFVAKAIAGIEAQGRPAEEMRGVLKDLERYESLAAAAAGFQASHSATITTDELAALFNLSRRTIQRHLIELRDADAIEPVETGGGRGHPALYQRCKVVPLLAQRTRAPPVRMPANLPAP